MSYSGLIVTGVFPVGADEMYPGDLDEWGEEQLQAAHARVGREVVPGTIRRTAPPAEFADDLPPQHRAFAWTADTRPAT